jgi:hypothetical protein
VDPFAIYTHNRFDILDFNDALVQGRRRWTEVLEGGNAPTAISATLKDRKGGILASSKVECAVAVEGFKVTRSANETTLYDLREVSYVRPAPFDTKSGSSFELVVTRPGGKPEMMFQCKDPAEMRQFVTVFLVLLSRQPSQ